MPLKWLQKFHEEQRSAIKVIFCSQYILEEVTGVEVSCFHQ